MRSRLPMFLWYNACTWFSPEPCRNHFLPSVCSVCSWKILSHKPLSPLDGSVLFTCAWGFLNKISSSYDRSSGVTYRPTMGYIIAGCLRCRSLGESCCQGFCCSWIRKTVYIKLGPNMCQTADASFTTNFWVTRFQWDGPKSIQELNRIK